MTTSDEQAIKRRRMSDRKRSDIPKGFTGWVVQPMPFDDDRGKSGQRAVFARYNYISLPTVVERTKHQEHQYGCVAYTKDPLPVNKAWRITVLKTTKKWLTTGVVSNNNNIKSLLQRHLL